MSLLDTPIRCRIGLHRGTVEPAYLLEKEVSGRSAFKCARCGAIID